MISRLRSIWTICVREMSASAASPAAWVFLTIFLVMASFCAFVAGGLFASGQADLSPFFDWMPWLFLFLVPALTMPMWSEERRLGVFELTLSFPVSMTELAIGKFLAGTLMLAAALALTAPIPLTALALGEPDPGAILCGYFGALLLGMVYLAVSSFCSALSKSQTASFLLSVLVCGIFLFAGWPKLTDILAGYLPGFLISAAASCAFLTNYQAFQKGVFDTSELVYALSLSAFFLALTRLVLEFVSSGTGSVFAPGAFSDSAFRRSLKKLFCGALYAFVIVCSLNMAAGAWKWRFDASSDHAYSISEGTREIAKRMDRPVTLRFYASLSDPAMPQPLRKYAGRAQWLLQEFADASNGKITLQTIDPRRDSGDEEAALLDGIRPLTDPSGNRFFLGLSAAWAERIASVPYLSPLRESRLEYDAVRAAVSVSSGAKKKIGVMSAFRVLGTSPRLTVESASAGEKTRAERAWFSISELAKDYELVEIPMDAAEIPQGLSALLVIHPSGIQRRTVEALDRWLTSGGKAAIFLDPRSFYAAIKARTDYSMIDRLDSELPELTNAWGVKMNRSLVAADMVLAYRKQLPDRMVTNPLVLNVPKAWISAKSPAMRNLNSLSLYFSGFFTVEKRPGIETETLFTTSNESSFANALVCDRPELVIHNFKAGGTPLPLGLHLRGKLRAFPGKTEPKPAEVFLFADSDMLFNDVCVSQEPDFFGLKTSVRTNDNTSLLQNVMDLLTGADPAMAAVRSRVPMSRPFTKINEIKAAAELRYRNRIVALERDFQTAQSRIDYLRKLEEREGGRLGSAERQAEMRAFTVRTARARRELEKVRTDLKTDLDRLENRIRMVNLLLVPALAALAGIVWNILRRCRCGRRNEK